MEGAPGGGGSGGSGGSVGGGGGGGAVLIKGEPGTGKSTLEGPHTVLLLELNLSTCVLASSNHSAHPLCTL